MIIILSGAYAPIELRSEIGEIPPSFLPLGNKRLYQYQISVLTKKFKDEKIFMTIPLEFKINKSTYNEINKLKVRLVGVSHKKTIGEALFQVLEKNNSNENQIRILHGDTLILHPPKEFDNITLGKVSDGLNWEIQKKNKLWNYVWSGFFSFEDMFLLKKSLKKNNHDFVKSIRYYEKQNPIKYVLKKDWFDFGNLSTYYKARAQFFSQRFFNSISAKENVLSKQSSNQKKINAEIKWFETIPLTLKKFLPQLLGKKEQNNISSYNLELLPYLPVNELYVFGKLPEGFWNKILELISNILKEFSDKTYIKGINKKQINQDFKNLFLKKTNSRLNYVYDKFYFLKRDELYINDHAVPTFSYIIDECQKYVKTLQPLYSIIHGDLCFGNMIYDSRAEQIKIFDPRGQNEKGKFMLFGDQKYDIAKLYHSLFGLYDFIKADQFEIIKTSKKRFEFDKSILNQIMENNPILMKKKIFGFTKKQIMPLVILLFASMIPLHEDKPNHQMTFIGNVLRLYLEWKES